MRTWEEASVGPERNNCAVLRGAVHSSSVRGPRRECRQFDVAEAASLSNLGPVLFCSLSARSVLPAVTSAACMRLASCAGDAPMRRVRSAER